MSLNLDNGLVGYWPMDEGLGSLITRDDSGHGNTGTLRFIGNSNWKTGVSGKCIEFDGVQEYINCENNNSLNISGNISISCWVYVDIGTTGVKLIVVKNNSLWQDMSYGLIWNSNKIIFGLNGDWRGSSASNSVIPGCWNHIVVVYNQTDVKYYVNGVLSGTPYLYSTPIIQNTHNVVIGKLNPDVDFWNGKLDEIRIYKRDININEIKYLYNNPSGTNKNIVSVRLLITDLDGFGHSITENIELVKLNHALSHASDTFAISLANYDDMYSYIEFGCEIEILIGIGGYNFKTMVGIVTDVMSMLDDENQVEARIDVTGEDIGYRLHNLFVFNAIENKEISQILIEILDTIDHTTGLKIRELANIDLSDGHIESTPYISKQTLFAWTPLSTAINELATYAGYDWYIDLSKKIHFFDPNNVSVSVSIIDEDIIGSPIISTIGTPINRSLVFGGFYDTVDLETPLRVKYERIDDEDSLTSHFVPNQNTLSSVYVWTSVMGVCDVVLKIKDSQQNVVANGTVTVLSSDIVDREFTKFKFKSFVNLVPHETYTIYLIGTTTAGVSIGCCGGATNECDIVYKTTYPTRVASIANDMESYGRYGLYMDIYVDKHIEDPIIADMKSASMIKSNVKKEATICIKNVSVCVGDVVNLKIARPGIKIDAHMKVVNSKLSMKHCYIENCLELEEL